MNQKNVRLFPHIENTMRSFLSAEDNFLPKSNKTAIDVCYIRKVLGPATVCTVLGEGYQLTDEGVARVEEFLASN